MIHRRRSAVVRERPTRRPVVVLLGPREAGKTTLAPASVDASPAPSSSSDLDRPADRARLADADARALPLETKARVPRDEVDLVPPALPATSRRFPPGRIFAAAAPREAAETGHAPARVAPIDRLAERGDDLRERSERAARLRPADAASA